jgi:starch synthase
LAKQAKLNICLTSSELAPFAKTGGLADVTAALSAYLHRSGHDVRVLIPRYSRIDRMRIDIEPVEQLQDLRMHIGGHDVHYAIDTATLPGSNLDIFLLRCPTFFRRDGIYTQDDDEHLRFTMLSRAAIEMCQKTGFAPHIFSCHDWQTSLIPLYLRSVYAWDRLFAETRSVLTIHNIGYQGMFPANVLGQLGLDGAEQHLHQDDLTDGVINFLKTGVLYADLITTVSPTYAREILGEEYGMGLNYLLRERANTLVGILNGVDYSEWDPAVDTMLPANYSAKDMSGKAKCKSALMRDLGLDDDPDMPLVGIISRLVGQKGFDLVKGVVPRLLVDRRFSLAVLGSGETHLESFFAWLQHNFDGRVCFYKGYNNKLAHWIEAGADMFLMPSRYEPCGLNQMYSLRYGTVPIVRETGGLADSVQPYDPDSGTGTGIVFRNYDEQGLAWALNSALDLYADKPHWRRMVANGMAMDYSWERQGARYVELFRQLSNVE